MTESDDRPKQAKTKISQAELELVCSAWHEAGRVPGQLTWSHLKEHDDPRLYKWRHRVIAALREYDRIISQSEEERLPWE